MRPNFWNLFGILGLWGALLAQTLLATPPLLAVSALRAGESTVRPADLWRYMHPNAKAVIGIHWPRIRQSEAGMWIRKEWIDGETLPITEFLDNATEILISSPGIEERGQEPPLVIAIQDSLDLDRVTALLEKCGYKEQLFGGIPVYRSPSRLPSEPAFALPGNKVILAGDLQSLFSTLERAAILTGNGPEENPLMARGQALAAKYDCWALLTEPKTIRRFLVWGLGEESGLGKQAFSPDSKDFEAGVLVNSGITAEVFLDMANAGQARNMAANLGSALKTRKLFPSFKISQDQDRVMVSMSLDHPSETPVTAPMPPAVKMIRIEGLDGGPIEIPLGP